MRLSTGTVYLDRACFERRDGKTFHLTGREVTLLSYLADRAGQDVSRDELLTEVWGYHPLSTSRAVDAGVARLRRKLEVDSKHPEVLCTVHGDGYRLVLRAGPSEPAVPVQPRRLLALGDRTVDLDGGFVRCGGEKVQLTTRERKLLLVLADRPETLVEARSLARRVGVCGGTSALANVVYRLRSKIEPDPSDPRWLVGVRGQGYQLRVPHPLAPSALERGAGARALDGGPRRMGILGEAHQAWYLALAAVAALTALASAVGDLGEAIAA